MGEAVAANDQDLSRLSPCSSLPEDASQERTHQQRQGEQSQDSTYEEAAGKDVIATEEQDREEDGAGCDQSGKSRFGPGALTEEFVNAGDGIMLGHESPNEGTQ
jgi:hypothetical protein